MKTVNNVHDREKTSPKESVQNISEKSIGDSGLMTEVLRGLLQGFWKKFHLWDKTTRSQIHNEMRPYLTVNEIDYSSYLYSVDIISRLTNLQIQYIIDQVTVNNVHDQTKTEVSTSTKVYVPTKQIFPFSHYQQDSSNYLDSCVISASQHEDAYKITASSSLRPACNQYHKESITGGYREESYYINCLHTVSNPLLTEK
ncbi:hypothetical protein Glove_199g190 [Diversispora epigaea]|uniref:Uncharacterized protein n=1 Tax=Diversispora epigaea TaxID=1348612 RepID=A0A397INB3_9GLOM|nr:hypothetical protein Glove_199g190 [Diversispora epigaea]